MPTTTPDPHPAPRPDAAARHRTPGPRSLADEFRSWPDSTLLALLRARPDLAVPRPNEFGALAARAASRAAVHRAVDGLDTAGLQVIEVLATLPEPVTTTEVSQNWGAPAGPVLARLRALALVWGTPRALHLVRTVRDVLGPYPAGLGPPLTEALGRRSPQRLAQLLDDLGLPAAGDPDTALQRLTGHLRRAEVLTDLLAGAPPGAQTVLDRLVWGPPIGQVTQADRSVRRASANGPVEWLLAHGMLAVADPAHVVLPREIGLALRGGRVHRSTEVEPPPLSVQSRPAAAVSGTAAAVSGTAATVSGTAAAAAAAAEIVRLVEELGELWEATPPRILRAGGLGVRELRRTATILEVDEATAATVIELAHLSGLVADDGEAEPRWAPTPAYDTWLAGDTGHRWVTLVTAWLPTTRCPQLVGTRDARDAPRQALGKDLDQPSAPAVRWWVLRTLAAAAPEAVDPLTLRTRLDWLSPRQASRTRDALIDWVLEDATRLGVLGAGALTTHGRVALERPDHLGAAAKALDDALPPTVSHVLLQADLTAVVPGPPDRELARELALLADIESRGGATVYRFSADSVRRALDAGRTAEDTLALLARRSRTPVPQPLTYLVGDIARRHGQIRVSAAQAFVRADDESVLATLLADRRAAGLRLRRLAPTVLAAQAPPATVLDQLRGLGLTPVAEGPDGDVVVCRREQHRTGPRTPPRPVSPIPMPVTWLAGSAGSAGPNRACSVTGTPDPLRQLPGVGNVLAVPASPATEAALAAVVTTVRAADQLTEQAGPAQHPMAQDDAPPVPPGEVTDIIARLREAATGREPIWIGYADTDGQITTRLVQPLHVDGGQLQALDHAAQRVRTYVVHRVTGVAAAGS